MIIISLTKSDRSDNRSDKNVETISNTIRVVIGGLEIIKKGTQKYIDEIPRKLHTYSEKYSQCKTYKTSNYFQN